MRFLAGVGLAGEFGFGVTLLSEILPREKRGYAVSVVASLGILGAVVAGFFGEIFSWRYAYVIGGFMGASLLVLRLGMKESVIFHHMKDSGLRRGDLRLMFFSGRRLWRYFRCIVVGVPILVCGRCIDHLLAGNWFGSARERLGHGRLCKYVLLSRNIPGKSAEWYSQSVAEESSSGRGYIFVSQSGDESCLLKQGWNFAVSLRYFGVGDDCRRRELPGSVFGYYLAAGVLWGEFKLLRVLT